MKNKPILIVPGDPNSIFFEIFFKSLKSNKFKSPLILITYLNVFQHQMKKFNFNKNINLISLDNVNNYSSFKSAINIINVNYNKKKKVKSLRKRMF